MYQIGTAGAPFPRSRGENENRPAYVALCLPNGTVLCGVDVPIPEFPWLKNAGGTRDNGSKSLSGVFSDCTCSRVWYPATGIKYSIFLYSKVLEKPLGTIGASEKPKRPQRFPVVLTREEVDHVLREMTGIYALMAGLLYGSGLRLMECVRLRVKDIDFAQRQIMVRDGKGAKDRVTVLPEKSRETLATHLEQVKKQHITDSHRSNRRCFPPGEAFLYLIARFSPGDSARENGRHLSAYMLAECLHLTSPTGDQARR